MKIILSFCALAAGILLAGCGNNSNSYSNPSAGSEVTNNPSTGMDTNMPATTNGMGGMNTNNTP
jgi:hypothetical protein